MFKFNKKKDSKHVHVEFVGNSKMENPTKDELERIQKALDELNYKLLTKNEELIRNAKI